MFTRMNDVSLSESLVILYSKIKKRTLLANDAASFKTFSAKMITVTTVIGSLVSRADTDVCAALNLFQKKIIKIIKRSINDNPSKRVLMIIYLSPLLPNKTLTVRYPYKPLKTKEKMKLKRTRDFVRYSMLLKG